MTFKHLQAIGLAAALTIGASSIASAQTAAPQTAPTTTDQTLVTTTERDRGFDWGWLGLLGLIGLAGLGGRSKRDAVAHTDGTRTADVNRTNVYDKAPR